MPVLRHFVRQFTRQSGLNSSRYFFNQRNAFITFNRFNSTASAPSPDSTSTFIPTKATPEELLKKGHEAEMKQEQEEQQNVEGTTGMIDIESKESLIYVANMYPVVPVSTEYASRTLAFLLGLTESRVKNILTQKSIPEDFPVKLTQVIPRYKDGGVFAKYTLSSNAPPELTPKDVESVISTHLKEAEYRHFFNPFRAIRSFSVKGVPWIEDLKRRPSQKVKVVFEGPDLSQETLYSLLRRYGSIKDITSPPAGSKDPERFAIVEFSRTRHASTARNCVNSLVVGSTKIHITYIPVDNINFIQKFIVDHPRISIPILLALFAAFAVVIFDPIRAWFIERKVTKNSIWASFERYPLIHNISGYFRNIYARVGEMLHLSFDSYKPTFENLWSERQETVRKIRQWLNENVNTFIVVNGPRGNGKRELVQQFVLSERPNVLLLDCDLLTKAQNDSTFLKAAAKQLGYFPAFPWMKNIAAYLDLIIQGLTGQKSGFSETTEDQFKNMLNTAVTALKNVALQDYEKAISENNSQDANAVGDSCKSNTNSARQLTEEAYLQLHSEAKPVVVISHYLNKRESDKAFIYKHLAEFASILVQANLAHVIFITNDISFDSVLSPALPNRIFKVATVGDADAKAAKTYVLRQIIEARKTAAAAQAAMTELGSNNSPANLNLSPEELKAQAEKEAKELAVAEQELNNELKQQQKQADSENSGSGILGYVTGGLFSFDKSADKEGSVEKNEDKNSKAEKTKEEILFDEQTLEHEYPYLDYALVPLGGRLTDLQAFARRLKSGEKPLEAAEDMVDQSATEILQMFLGRTSRTQGSSASGVDNAPAEWTREQAWTIIKLLGNLSVHPFTKERQMALAKAGKRPGADLGMSKINANGSPDFTQENESEPVVSLSFLLLDPNFKTKEQQKALTALQRTEMITLVQKSGRTVAIKAGKPLFQAAFKSIVSDKIMYSIQESALLESLMKAQTAKIQTYEAELSTLAQLPQKWEVRERMNYLNTKLIGCQDKIEKYEKEYLLQLAIMGGKK